MGNNKEIIIKNRYCYFFNDMINVKIFYSNLLKIGKKSCRNISIYYIGYFTSQTTDDYENIQSVNPLYLIIGKIDKFIEEKNRKQRSIEKKHKALE